MRQARKLILLFLLILLTACQSLPAFIPPTPTITSTPTLAPTATFTPTPTLTPTPTVTPTPTFTPTPVYQVRRVLILSIDGLRPDAISLAPMPNLQRLMQSSAYSLGAQTVYPKCDTGLTCLHADRTLSRQTRRELERLHPRKWDRRRHRPVRRRPHGRPGNLDVRRKEKAEADHRIHQPDGFRLGKRSRTRS